MIVNVHMVSYFAKRIKISVNNIIGEKKLNMHYQFNSPLQFLINFLNFSSFTGYLRLINHSDPSFTPVLAL